MVGYESNWIGESLEIDVNHIGIDNFDPSKPTIHTNSLAYLNTDKMICKMTYDGIEIEFDYDLGGTSSDEGVEFLPIENLWTE